jgi:hypothetical protein
MSQRASAQILPMKTAGTQHLIERTYREGGEFQWVREALVNAEEAGATRIEFGIEWQAVENHSVYRRTIADDGCGMTAEQLVEFFNTFGGGGKPIGGAHENFGVGSKTSLMPWNPYGMVVVSWVDGDASMIWVMRDPLTGEYGLKVEPCGGLNGEETLEAVYAPYDDPAHGCNWANIKPSWVKDHGTVIVLLGSSAGSHTVEGDPTRAETDIKGISTYLNRRFWRFKKGLEVYVDELRTADRSSWPQSEAVAHGPINPVKDQRTNMRCIEGARFYIAYERASSREDTGALGPFGKVKLKDGTAVRWYLWEGKRPNVGSYAAHGGYIGALYRNELYDITVHHSTYRSFAVVEKEIRSRLWLIICPPVEPDGKKGVYPRTDRNSLLIKGGPSAGEPLPINDWAAEFADKMPEELVAALQAARKGGTGTIDDEKWREKLAERFGARWRLSRLRMRKSGPKDATELMRESKRKSASGGSGGGGSGRAAPVGLSVLGRPGGPDRGEDFSESGGVPGWRAVGGDDLGPGMLAAWEGKTENCQEPRGVRAH